MSEASCQEMFLDWSWDVNESSASRRGGRSNLSREGGFDLLLADVLLRTGGGRIFLPLGGSRAAGRS